MQNSGGLFLLRIKEGGAPAVSSTGNQGAPLWRDPMETRRRKTYVETAATVPISLRARHKMKRVPQPLHEAAARSSRGPSGDEGGELRRRQIMQNLGRSFLARCSP